MHLHDMIGRLLRASSLSLACVKLALAFLVIASPASLSLAQTTPPITPTTGTGNMGTTVTQAGNTSTITGGTRPSNGPNLFHSFGEFGVPTSHLANFLNDTATPTSNILGRVTGGNPSTILGTIQTTGFGSANLFLMNPAGIVFGPSASLNVGGSATFTTADYLRLTDGARFTAMPGPADAVHLQRPGGGVWISGNKPGAITVQGGHLRVSEGHGISLVGGNIEVTAGMLENGTTQPARISAPGGQINVVSVTGAGEQTIVGVAGLAGPSLDPASAPSPGGTIHLTSGAMLQTSSSTGNAGPILIRGGQLVMENATLAANTSSKTADAVPSSTTQGDIFIQADSVNLSNGSTLSASTSGDGKAGNITFEVGTLRSNIGDDGVPLVGAAPVTIASSSTGQGGAGMISMAGPAGQAADHISLSNTEIVASVTDAAIPTIAPVIIGEQVETSAPKYARLEPPATINIAAEHVTLANGTTIGADTTGGADAGAIKVNADRLETRAGPDGRVLISSTSNCGEGCLGGQSGDITLQGLQDADHAVTRTYAFVLTPEVKGTETYVFHLARNIDLQGTDIHSDALGNAPGGKVLLRAQEQVSLTDSHISVETQDFNIDGVKPNGQLARYQGFSVIDIIAPISS